MSKYQFNTNERYAVYKVFNGKCQWCGEPLEFKDLNIDHLIPEVLLQRPEDLKKILDSYGLDDSFKINDFDNWIPMHQNCNNRKNDAVYSQMPIILTLLNRCALNKDQARRIKSKLEKEPKKAEILIRIKSALDKEVIDTEGLQQFILDYSLEDIDNESKTEIDRLIKLGILKVIDHDKWAVSKILNDSEVFVTDGKLGGIAPRDLPPHISWLCPNCLHFGPWDGNRCLNCGKISAID